jgi:hypothetical protein
VENEVRRLVSLAEQHDQQMTTLNTDHSRRLQEERNRWESKQVDLFRLAFSLNVMFLFWQLTNCEMMSDQQTLIRGL